MSSLDWLVLIGTLLFIIIYGIYKSKGPQNLSSYLLADKRLPWYHVGLSVMATQASAITFLSAPGLGCTDGLRFVQFYFGLPIAMIVLCITFIPMFSKLNVYTAYEFIEKRFDNKTRQFTAFLFLLQRGLSTGVTIFAPAIILSTILHVDVFYTIIANGIMVVIYTLVGGTKAVSYTQLLQMIIIFSGLFLAMYLVINLLPTNVSISKALYVAGAMQHINAIDTSFDWHNRYNIWSGIIGGFFLQLSYFGTDQSQVGRYLTGSSITQSRLGLVMNSLLKIPMQFFILLIGVFMFVFYQFTPMPVFFNKIELSKIATSQYADSFKVLQNNYNEIQLDKKNTVLQYVNAVEKTTQSNQFRSRMQAQNDSLSHTKNKITALMKTNDTAADTNDTNYIFLGFVTTYLPKGVVGLLIAIIFLAAMGSTASGLSSLASTTIIDFYKQAKPNYKDAHYVKASKVATLVWGVFCIAVAFFASRLGNLIEAVNILGSLFYGNILGIFLVAFYIKYVKSNAVFIAALITETIILYSWYKDAMAFLWLNVLGCLVLIILATVIQMIINQIQETEQ